MRKNYVWLMLAILVLGCGDKKGNQENAGSALEGLFGQSEAEQANAKARKAQIEQAKNEAEQMQKDRLDSY